jgi:general secretion pathway protein A
VAASLTAATYYTGYIDRIPGVAPVPEKMIAGPADIKATEPSVSAAATDTLPTAVMIPRAADPERMAPSLVAETAEISTGTAKMVKTPLPEPTFSSQPIETGNSAAPTPDPSALLSSGNAEQTSTDVASDHPTAEMPTSLSPSSSYEAALRNLLKLWSIDPEPLRLADDCRRLDIPDLRCLNNKSTIEDLLNLDRPALLIFYSETNAPYYTTLRHIEDDQVTLLFGDHSFTVALNELTGRWYGQSIMLWRPPPGFTKPLTIGDRGMAVDWLQNHLALLEDTPMAAQQKHMYDDFLSQQVKKFQLTNGLVPDGIAGAKTLIKINSLTGIKVPTLMNPDRSE